MSLRETSWHNGIADGAASTTVNQDNDEAAAAAFAISGPANGAQASPKSTSPLTMLSHSFKERL